MCCHCRRVRSAAGEWQSPVLPPRGKVSHGICPSCLRTYYPDYAPVVEQQPTAAAALV